MESATDAGSQKNSASTQPEEATGTGGSKPALCSFESIHYAESASEMGECEPQLSWTISFPIAEMSVYSGTEATGKRCASNATTRRQRGENELA